MLIGDNIYLGRLLAAEKRLMSLKYVSLRYRAIVGCSINRSILESCGENNEYDILHPLKFSWTLLRFVITKFGCNKFIFIGTKRSANILSKRQKIYINEDVSKLLKKQIIHYIKNTCRYIFIYALENDRNKTCIQHCACYGYTPEYSHVRGNIWECQVYTGSAF